VPDTTAAQPSGRNPLKEPDARVPTSFTGTWPSQGVKRALAVVRVFFIFQQITGSTSPSAMALRLPLHRQARPTPLAIWGYPGMAVFMLVAAVGVAFLTDLPKTVVVMVGFSFFITSFAIGVGGTGWLIQGEVFPTAVRGQAAAIGAAVERGAVTTPRTGR
jgi:Sugar (and other) transporter